MEQSTIALIILGVTMVLVVIDKIPLAFTATFAALAMALTGVIDLKGAYSNFAAETIVFTAASMMICNGLFLTGAIQKITSKLLKGLYSKGERACVAAISAFTGFITGFTTNTAIASTMVPIARSIAKESDGKVSAKHLLMPVGLMSTIGSPLTLSGAAAVAAAAAMVKEAGGEMGYFAMAPIGIALIVIGTIYFATIGYSIQKKTFDFEDPDITDEVKMPDDIPSWKPIINIAVFLLTIVGYVTGVWDLAIVSMLGVLVLWITNTVSVKDSVKICDWNVIIVLSGVTALASGLSKSGAGAVIANAMLGLFGEKANNPFFVMLVLALVGWLLTQFMSNTAANSIVIPIAISLAQTLGVNVVYFCAPVIVATAIAICTPLASPTTVIVMQGGFRFKDFARIGLPLSLILMIVTIAMTPMLYVP